MSSGYGNGTRGKTKRASCQENKQTNQECPPFPLFHGHPQSHQPLITCPTPTVNSNGSPRSTEESNWFLLRPVTVRCSGRGLYPRLLGACDDRKAWDEGWRSFFITPSSLSRDVSGFTGQTSAGTNLTFSSSSFSFSNSRDAGVMMLFYVFRKPRTRRALPLQKG